MIRFALFLIIIVSLSGCFGNRGLDGSPESDPSLSSDIGVDTGNPEGNIGVDTGNPQNDPNNPGPGSRNCDELEELDESDRKEIVDSICERLVSCGVIESLAACQEAFEGLTGAVYMMALGLIDEEQANPANNAFEKGLIKAIPHNYEACLEAIPSISCATVESHNGGTSMLPEICGSVLFGGECTETVEKLESPDLPLKTLSP